MILAILRALSRAVRRDLGTFGSLTVNNFALFVALMIYGNAVSGTEPKSAYPFLLLLGFLLLFPLSSDPLAKIPHHRLALWPLHPGQRLVLRLTSLALSPVAWLTVALLFKAAPSLALLFLALSVGVHLLPSPVLYVPPLPGRGGGLVRKNLRQMLSVLDTYLALLLTLGGTVYRFAAQRPDPSAFPMLALLVAMALSTYAQCLFSLDSQPGLTRYRLLPLPGWRILLAKDIAFLGLLLVLTVPLDAVAGITFGLAALAIGHWPSVTSRLPLKRWRFTGGRVKYGVAQVVCGTALVSVPRQYGFLCLLVASAAYLCSLYACGKRIGQATPP